MTATFGIVIKNMDSKTKHFHKGDICLKTGKIFLQYKKGREYWVSKKQFIKTNKILKINAHKWRINNKEKARKRESDRWKNNPDYHRIHAVLSAAKNRAKLKGVPFSLTYKDIEIPTICPVLGIPLIRGGGAPRDNCPSLDRIIPKLGYVCGNIMIISMRANRIKNDATPDELVKIAAFYALK